MFKTVGLRRDWAEAHVIEKQDTIEDGSLWKLEIDELNERLLRTNEKLMKNFQEILRNM